MNTALGPDFDPSLLARGPEFDVHRRDEPSNDRRWANDPLYTEGVKAVSREREAAESAFSPGIPATGMERLWSLAGATSGNRWQMPRRRKRRKQAETVALGCDQLP
jgi:hypothetical protein